MAKKSFTGTSAAEKFFPADSRKKPAGIPAEIPEQHKESKTRRVQLLMKPSVHDAIKKQATARGYSFNEYVNTILEIYAEQGS